MSKTKKKAAATAAAATLAELSRRKRMRTLTATQRSEQGRKAVAARRDRQPSGPWFGLVVLPKDYIWKGTEQTAKILDEAFADSGKVVFWSQDKKEVVARSQEPELIDRVTMIVEQDWNPNALRFIREYEPDPERQVEALRTVLNSERGNQ